MTYAPEELDPAQWVDAPACTQDPRPGTRPLADTALGALGIELLHCGSSEVVARMPVAGDRWARACLLVLAETVASTAAGLAAGSTRRAFGAELDAALPCEQVAGIAIARAAPLRTDDDLHVWELTIVREDGQLLLTGRCTLGIVAAPTLPFTSAAAR